MRVLLLSPFAPTARHYHAAADTIVQLVPRLAEKTELFMYSPQNGSGPQQDDLKYTVLPSAVTPASSTWDRLGAKPAWLRQAWSRGATQEVRDLVNRLKPDVVHGEYLQTAEALATFRNSVLVLHDITENVMRESFRAASGPEKGYRLAELVRTRRFERTAIQRAGAVLTLSDADLAIASRYNPHAFLNRPGVEIADVPWAPPSEHDRPRLIFAGAMWRRANALVARFLADDVMPTVWRRYPTAELRIVGAEPPADIVALGRADSRVVVTGAVPDIRAEMRAAHAVLVPSIVGGGVLMKVVHAMALGCPVITSSGPADSVRGDASMLHVADTADGLAAAVTTVLESPDDAAARGGRARAHIERTFRWDNTVQTYLDAYAIASSR